MDGNDNGYIKNQEKEKERLKNVKEYQDKFFKKIYKKGGIRNDYKNNFRR